MTADELIEALEKATGPDRKLDAEIDVRLPSIVGGIKWLPSSHDNCAAGTYWHNIGSADALWTAPAYTASLDAALTLVPEGRARHTAYLPSGSWPYRVWIFRDANMPLEDESGWPVLGKTEPLAICIAALRARSTKP